MLSLNIATRSFAGLRGPLDFHQVAPVGFLWIERVAVLAGGVGEASLRSFPLISSCTAIVATWWSARRMSGLWVALLATSFVSLSSLSILFSRQTKPYASDAMLSALVLGMALRPASHADSARKWLELALVGFCAILLSLPSAFVLAGVVAGLWLAPGVRRSQKARRWLLACAIGWGCFYLALFFTIYNEPASISHMRGYWQPHLLGGSNARLAAYEAWHAVLGAMQVLHFGEGIWRPSYVFVLLVILLEVLGAWTIRRDHGAWATTFLVAPIVLVGLAATVELYPIATRLLLFLLPQLAILLAAGIHGAARAWTGRADILVGSVSLGLILLPSLTRQATTLVRPDLGEHSRPVVRVYQSQFGHEPVYIAAGGIPAWAFYATEWSTPDRPRIDWIIEHGQYPAAFEVAPNSRFAIDEPARLQRVLVNGRLEILGVPPWVSAGAQPGLPGDVADDWASEEAMRIRRAGPTVWLFFTHARPARRERLTAKVEQAGGRLDKRISAQGALMLRYVFR